MNYLPFIGFALVLLGIRLRFMIKIVNSFIKGIREMLSLMPFSFVV